MEFEFYQLNARPFRLTPDPRAFFASRAHSDALESLSRGLAQGEGIIVLTGPEGSGKSIVAARFLAGLDPDHYVVAQIVSSRLNGPELIDAVAHAFEQHGIELASEHTSKARTLLAIERFLQREAATGRRCLLVIDEAHNLSAEALEELRMLLNFQHHGEPVLQILLVAAPEFEEQLQHLPAVTHRVVAAHRLEGISPEEVSSYVEHRLQLAGWDGENPAITPEVYTQLALSTSGNPQIINRLCDRLIQTGDARRSTILDAALLTEVAGDLARQWITPPAVRTALKEGETRIEATLAVHDELIIELQQAVVELAEIRNSAYVGQGREDEILDALAETAQRIAALETRTLEQQQTIRHTLTMLIEWIEGGANQRIAA